MLRDDHLRLAQRFCGLERRGSMRLRLSGKILVKAGVARFRSVVDRIGNRNRRRRKKNDEAKQRAADHGNTSLLSDLRPGNRAAPQPNLLFFGNPFGGRRPASARLPIQSRNSRFGTLKTRPAASFQFKPSASWKTCASEMPP